MLNFSIIGKSTDIEPDVVGALSEAALVQLTEVAQDLVHFSLHAKRTTVSSR